MGVSVVYTYPSLIYPDAYNQHIESTRTYMCDVTDNTKGNKYRYESVKVAVLASLSATNNMNNEQSVVDAIYVAIDQYNTQNGGVKLNNIRTRIVPIYFNLLSGTNITHLTHIAHTIANDTDIHFVFGGTTSLIRSVFSSVLGNIQTTTTDTNTGTTTTTYTQKLLLFPEASEGEECRSNVVYGGPVFNQHIEKAFGLYKYMCVSLYLCMCLYVRASVSFFAS